MLMDDRITEGHFIKYVGKQFGAYQEGLHNLYSNLEADETPELQERPLSNSQSVQAHSQNVAPEDPKEIAQSGQSRQPPRSKQAEAMEANAANQAIIEQLTSILPADHPSWARVKVNCTALRVQLAKILAEDHDEMGSASQPMQPYAAAPEGMAIKRLKRAEERGHKGSKKQAGVPLSLESPEKNTRAEPFKIVKAAKPLSILHNAVINQTQHQHRKALAAQQKYKRTVPEQSRAPLYPLQSFATQPMQSCFQPIPATTLAAPSQPTLLSQWQAPIQHSQVPAASTLPLQQNWLLQQLSLPAAKASMELQAHDLLPIKEKGPDSQFSAREATRKRKIIQPRRFCD